MTGSGPPQPGCGSTHRRRGSALCRATPSAAAASARCGERGEARASLAAAVRLADHVRLDALPAMLGERRSRYLLDVARAHAAGGDTRSATRLLLHAESISADEVRHHRITRQLVPALIAHEHGDTGLRGLARRSRIPL